MQVFVDESKRRGVVLVAVVVPLPGVVAARRAMRALLLPNQSHLHFTKEPDRRRKQIIDMVLATRATFRVYDASGVRDQRVARAECLRRAVTDLAPFKPLLVIERDESLVRADRSVLSDEIHRQGLGEVVEHRHVPKRDDPGLWLADAVAWCWTHPQWRPRLGEVAVTDISSGD